MDESRKDKAATDNIGKIFPNKKNVLEGTVGLLYSQYMRTQTETINQDGW